MSQLHFYIPTKTKTLGDAVCKNIICNSNKKIRYQGISLTKDIQDLLGESYKTSVGDIK